MVFYFSRSLYKLGSPVSYDSDLSLVYQWSVQSQFNPLFCWSLFPSFHSTYLQTTPNIVRDSAPLASDWRVISTQVFINYLSEYLKNPSILLFFNNPTLHNLVSTEHLSVPTILGLVTNYFFWSSFASSSYTDRYIEKREDIHWVAKCSLTFGTKLEIVIKHGWFSVCHLLTLPNEFYFALKRHNKNFAI